uniref:Ig-like domain-containing protein n=1 Tax=Pelusios castaneus TaxID=367368 RepID=A0A8C8RDV2_9SAUR
GLRCVAFSHLMYLERVKLWCSLLLPATPRLSIPRRLGVLNTASSFPCHVWGFYPGDIDIRWLRDGQDLTNTAHSISQRNRDGTFNLTLTYTFTPTASDSGSILSCRVSHLALAQPLQEGWGPDEGSHVSCFL